MVFCQKQKSQSPVEGRLCSQGQGVMRSLILPHSQCYSRAVSGDMQTHEAVSAEKLRLCALEVALVGMDELSQLMGAD